ncbi:retrovirus-related pol polyprotein from transposon TNT 1-94 [Tanacetum coccineum]|uniref:Retrovirus-related pol polyprotein from transposon TNT 1-94 n=1 Tax=Tanacetum coccineum TaxID=301880 RepID=A0ABQ5H895_9ASTR
MVAISNVPELVDKKGGSYFAVAPRLEPGKFTKWKKYDIMESVISCETTKDTWTDLVHSFEVSLRSGLASLRDLKMQITLRPLTLLISMKRDCQENSDDEANERTMSRGFQPKFTPKFIQSTQHAQSSQGEPKSSKPFQSKNKGLVAETFDWDKEEVSDDEEETRVQVLIALADDELFVGKNHALNGVWIDITIKRERSGLGTMKHTKPKTQESSNKNVSGPIIVSNTEPVTPLVPTEVIEGAVAESSQSGKSFIGVSCTICGSSVHSTTDHNDFEHFKRGEKLQATKAIIAPNEQDNPYTEDVEGNNTKTLVPITEILVLEAHQSQDTNHASTSAYHVAQDRWSRYQHIELVNIIGDSNEGMLTRSMALKLTAASVSKCIFTDFLSEIEPKKVSKALKHPGWVDAMQEDLNQFYRNKVWTLVILPCGKIAIGSKWVFKNKKDEHGIVTKNKARLVAQGYSSEEGINYDETFPPVARIEAIKIFLAFATYMNFIVFQIDVKSAFLNGKLKEKIYVKQPPGFESSEFPNYVCKLDKALYGLKEAPRACSLVKTPMVPPNNLGPELAGKRVNETLYRGMIRSLIPPSDDSVARPLKEYLIKFSMMNGKKTLNLDFKTFCTSTGLDYNNGEYVAHPSPKVVKAELAKIVTNPSYLDKTLVLKTPFMQLGEFCSHLGFRTKVQTAYPQDIEGNIQPVVKGSYSPLDEGTHKSQPFPEGTTTNPKDLGGNVQPADKGLPSTVLDEEPSTTPVADLSRIDVKYQADQAQSSRLRYRFLTKNKGKTFSKVESDTQTLLLTTAADAQSLLFSDDDLVESKNDVFEAGDEMDKDLHYTNEEETQSPSPNKEQPESSHA